MHDLEGSYLATSQAMELSEQPLTVNNVVQFGLYVAYSEIFAKCVVEWTVKNIKEKVYECSDIT
jgi:hypothetical protein